MEIKLKYIIISILAILFTIVNYFMIDTMINNPMLDTNSFVAILSITTFIVDVALFLYTITLIIEYCGNNWDKRFKIKL